MEDLLTNAAVGRLGTVGAQGRPMVKPVNFVYYRGSIYFHSARTGEKIDHITIDDRVCFEVDLPISYVKATEEKACGAGYLYQSVICSERAHFIDEHNERMDALRALMDKYQPEGGYGPFLEEDLALTAIVKIDIERMTGKQDVRSSAAATGKDR